ncbi:MAG TPA: thiolase family protein, partial [Candidatus Dormibacteraeota bacterium]|nr:thiolase family protein [Candidatus Dormibacteraeota bacterium]
GDGKRVDSAGADGLWCAFEDCHMGTHAERVAIAEQVSREDQDAFALRSHQRAIDAVDRGRFADELAPVTVVDAKGRETLVGEDETPRRDTSLEALARLKPAFELPTGADRREAATGTVTAGNAPGITDGAAATVVASERAVERYGLRPLARIVGYAQAEVAPKWLFLAPVEGVRRLLDRIELPMEAFDLIEINEAFAAQTLADGRALGFDWDKVNVNGGAIALGHPIGASGARIVATLLHELRRREGRYGLATLCLGGGGSVAMAFERASAA